MRKKYGVIFAVIGFISFCFMEARGADWKPYAADNNGFSYYDSGSITRPSETIVRVWTKYVFTEGGRAGMVAKLGAKYRDVDRGLYYSELNCADKTFRLLSTTIYSKEGAVIFSDSSVKEWKPIPPDSRGEVLYDMVCKGQKE